MAIILVLSIVALAVYLFISERLHASVVAMIVLCILMLTSLVGPFVPGFDQGHWISLADCTAGFSNAAMLSVAGMFILSAGLQRTGVISSMASLLHRKLRHPSLVIGATLALAALSSAFINNTAAVAVFLPILIASGLRYGVAPSRLLIPLSYAAQVGGVCTLIGTSTNLLVASIAEQAGLRALGIFEFAPLGLILTGVALAYFLLLGRWLLPEREGSGQAAKEYQVSSYRSELRVGEDSLLIGRACTPELLQASRPARVLAVRRRGELLPVGQGEDPVAKAGDVVVVDCAAADLIPLCRHWKLKIEAEHKFGAHGQAPTELGVAELTVPASSDAIGRTVAELDLLGQHRCIVVALHQAAAPLAQNRLAKTPLRSGDVLLVTGTQRALERLRDDRTFLVLDKVSEPALRHHKRPLAVAIFAFSILLAATNVVPILFSLLLGAILMVATGCMTIEEGLESVDWRVLLLLACMIPLGRLIEISGVSTLLATHATDLARPLGAYGALAIIYLVTAVLTEFMSNNAAAVLLSPVAIAMAKSLGIDPMPMLIAVCFAASTSFCTPVGYQTNAMVQNPGGYHFSDYMRAGLPLNILFLIVSVLCIPLFWAF